MPPLHRHPTSNILSSTTLGGTGYASAYHYSTPNSLVSRAPNSYYSTTTHSPSLLTSTTLPPSIGGHTTSQGPVHVNPHLSTTSSPHHNIVVHSTSTTTAQPIVVLLQKKRGIVTAHGPHPHPPEHLPHHPPHPSEPPTILTFCNDSVWWLTAMTPPTIGTTELPANSSPSRLLCHIYQDEDYIRLYKIIVPHLSR